MNARTPFAVYLRILLAAFVVNATPCTAFAVADSPWSFFLAGAYPFSIGPTHHWVNGEFGITGGFGYQGATWPIGLQFEGMTYRFGFNDNASSFAGSDGYSQVTAGTANVTWTPEKYKQGKFKPRLISGIGVYNRVIRTTQSGIVAGGCWDPWWGYVPCAAPGTLITSSYSQTKFGFNVGGGIDWETSPNYNLFIETRYHHAFTNHEATQFFPINFGIRW